jgi:hypothetical protein
LSAAPNRRINGGTQWQRINGVTPMPILPRPSVSSLPSYAAGFGERPIGLPKPLPFSSELKNVLRWIPRRRPDPAERSFADRVVKRMIAFESEEAGPQ